MGVPETEVQRGVVSFSQALREGELRLTQQRLQIARAIAGSEAHPDAETVYPQVRPIRHVYHSSFDGLEAADPADELGMVESVQVQLHGLCMRCQERESGDE